MKHQLKDYSLYLDGSIEVEPSRVVSMLLSGVPIDKLFVTEINNEIEQFNKFSREKISTKTNINNLSFNWSIPDYYKYIDIDNYLLDLSNKIEHDHLYEKRKERLLKEISLFKKHNMQNILRSIIFIIDTFKKNQIVWGVGRGSSCSSYILFLIGLHNVDCVLYDIEIEDFLNNKI